MSFGYIRIKIDGIWVLEHRYIMETFLKRKLGSEEFVHHKDGNRKNNNIDNLELTDKKKHAIHHGIGKETKFIRLNCPICSRVFEKEMRNSHIIKKNFSSCCSRRCSAILSNKFRNLTDEDKEKIIKSNVLEIYSRKRMGS